MKKIVVLFAIVFAFVLFVTPVMAEKPGACTSIQSGKLVNSAGVVITTGYDQWGYNYQANMFNGKYCDSYRDAEWCLPYKDVNLSMKWNDAWMSNKDCDGDGLLDRYFGYNSYIGSGAWLTNHQSGTEDGKKWTYFTKIVAKPTNEFVCSSVGGVEVWGAFCSILEVNGGNLEMNESIGGNGAVLRADIPGFGYWQP